MGEFARLFVHLGGLLPVPEPSLEGEMQPIARLREAFDGYDPDGSGQINLEAVVKLNDSKSGRPMAAWEARDWISERDRDGKGFLDFEDWIDYFERTGRGMTPPRRQVDSETDQITGDESAHDGEPQLDPGLEQAVRAAFEEYDVDNDGLITFGELKAVFARQNRVASDQELREWIRKRDRSHLGGVSFRDFRDVYVSRLVRRGRRIY